MTIRLPGAEILWVVHSDHASIWDRYGDMTPQILDARTWTLKERREMGEKEERGGERKGKGKWKRKRKGKRKEKKIGK